ncbi:MAG: S-layer protein [uncultured bacterium (gcode 4)]|uniref:S-layer protein n=1 Tax=uncultured bacterium (gcode 4) TaxID=1234023 RepID=K2GYG0_9BACT|nr:MAG: S-layer protein [uncultured bacterium (gcode 4)]
MKKSYISLAIAFLPTIIYASEINWSLNTSNLNNWIQMSLPCETTTVANGQVNAVTCEISCNPNYTKSGNSCVQNNGTTGTPAARSSWGWGSLWVTLDYCSNWDTSASYYDGYCSAGVLAGANGISSPISWNRELIGIVKVSVKTVGNRKVAELTGADWTLVLRASENSLLKATIPVWVTVSSDIDWDWTIMPPSVIKSASADRIWAAVVLAGGKNHALEFSKDLTISVPSSLRDWRDVFIYYADHGDLADIKIHWIYKIANRALVFPTNHLSHFVLKKKAQNLAGDRKFSDTHITFAKEDIDNLAYLWAIKWFEGWRFMPEKPATRAEFLAMAMKSMDITVDESARYTTFMDIPLEWTWMIKYIEKAKSMWIINWQMIGWKMKFRPNDSISRAEAASILIKLSNLTIVKSSSNSEFADVHEDWMKPFVSTAQSLWIFNWQNISWELMFRPDDPITRAESAKVINKVILDYPLPPKITITDG